MENIESITINNEKIHIKKSFDGWRVIYPIKNEDGSYNWFNLLTGGSYWRLIIMIFVVLIILGFLYEYTSNLNYCAKMLSNTSFNVAGMPITLNNITLRP